MAQADEDAAFKASLPQKGEANVRVSVEAGGFTRRHRNLAREWLAEQELARLKAGDQLAEASFKEARRSADAAERAVKWAIWAVVVGVVSTVASLFSNAS